MNVPAIQKALERIRYEHSIRSEGNSAIVYLDAVVRVGLRACDSSDKCDCMVCEGKISVIADILREAGVKVAE